MNTIQNAREAQHMWAYKFESAGREGITLSIGKIGSLANTINRMIHKIVAKAVVVGNLREGFQPVYYRHNTISES